MLFRRTPFHIQILSGKRERTSDAASNAAFLRLTQKVAAIAAGKGNPILRFRYSSHGGNSFNSKAPIGAADMSTHENKQQWGALCTHSLTASACVNELRRLGAAWRNSIGNASSVGGKEVALVFRHPSRRSSRTSSPSSPSIPPSFSCALWRHLSRA